MGVWTKKEITKLKPNNIWGKQECNLKFIISNFKKGTCWKRMLNKVRILLRENNSPFTKQLNEVTNKNQVAIWIFLHPRRYCESHWCLNNVVAEKPSGLL